MWHITMILLKEDLQPKVMKFSQNVEIGRRGELTSVTITCCRQGFAPQALGDLL